MLRKHFRATQHPNSIRLFTEPQSCCDKRRAASYAANPLSSDTYRNRDDFSPPHHPLRNHEAGRAPRQDGESPSVFCIGTIPTTYSLKKLLVDPISQPLSPSDEVSLPTLDSIAEARQQKPSPPSSPPPPPSESSNASSTLEETEEDAHAQGAFNEETGEINWDCPCLGGMAHGPCGPQFREAFSCFVHSEDEVKGMDCVQHFQAMQDCFRAHPEEYGEQFEQQSEEVEGAVGGEVEGDGEVVGGVVKGGERGDEEVGGTLSVARQGAVRDGGIGGAENGSSQPPTPVTAEAKTGGGKGAVTAKAKKAKEQVSKDFGEPKSEIDEIVPKAAHDAR
ncbi:uncharacterized protein KY384_008718 [Bacidia gigantensis]|uniref:uncharacterized protein n=1 Tax=Bacidia gigantensis TaxID=2732470 RepID=UPI001D052EE6|nr:uncharacterized protein KY384_008718 [Bacidia gigantensis]KAG8526518.1 hypothetical protein KY384_008718 [Bacidia gigantensis]